MADLKAAAERLRKLAQKREQLAFPELRAATQQHILQESSDCLLAAQALEALAWQEETGANVRKGRDGQFFCFINKDDAASSYYYADTPLGAILAAMEGEL